MAVLSTRFMHSLPFDKLVLLRDYIEFLMGHRYSESTIRAYSILLGDFFVFLGSKPIEQCTKEDVDRYQSKVFEPKGYSISTQRQFISSLKIFVVFYPKCKIESLELVRPKKEKKLPLVLSKMEVIDLIKSIRNLKHRAIIAMIYSSGLRISELINLELQDINIDRKQIHIRSAKGRKDRYVVLGESILPLIKNYIMTYRPTKYFAEGHKGNRYTASSIRKFLAKACKYANIHKKVTPHTLRHSYATHLLEEGVNLRHIQELLGHSRPETTMVYTRVMKKDLLSIRSPLDSILMHLNKSTPHNNPQKHLLSGNF